MAIGNGEKDGKPRITEAEGKVMNALWGYEASTLGEVARRLESTKWNAKTVKTLIDRLCDKGAVGIEKDGRRNRYFATLDRDSFAKSEVNALAERLFGGSAHNLLAFFCKSRELSAEQARELISLLEEKEKS